MSIRKLIRTKQLQHVRIGKRDYVPEGAFEVYRGRKGWAMPERNNGAKLLARGSRRLLYRLDRARPRVPAELFAAAQRTAHRLKSFSPNGSRPKGDSMAQVIRLKS